MTAPDTPATQTVDQPRRRWRAPLLRLALAAASGFVCYLSFAPRDLWWLMPIGFAGFGLVLHGRRLWGGLGYGFVFGLALFLPLLTWLEDFLGAQFGPWPWLALSAALAAYLGVGGALCTLVARLPGAPVWMAAVIIATETPRTWWPLGGFPWGRVAFSQPKGAFLPLASVGGAPLVGFAVVLTGFGLATLVLRLRRDRSWRTLPSPAAAVVLPVAAGLALWPTIGTGADSGSLTVATVQGNAPNVGLGLLNEAGTLRANHLLQNQQLAEEIRSGAIPKPDLVVWPETATRVRGTDPVIDNAVAELGTPALIGAIYWPPGGGRIQNSEIVWDPRTGAGERYSKQELVPFAEYVPARAIASWVTPFVDDTSDMAPGTSTAVLDIAGTRVATPICYEIAYDYVSRDAVDAGAKLLVLPTNNAWFGKSEMSYQQLAMARLRAVEHSRAAVVSSTSGVSAFVEPDGTVTRSTEEFTAASLVGRVPLRDTTTLSDRLGASVEYGLIGIALVAVAIGVARTRRTRRTRAEDRRTTVAG
ncbi:apolipoprotein N-acyltransferase [Amycolatopsis cynarae]|uniref:Apolipoprotein N-acyltransferase n=1 Tax=Amycolatopsis cynarae TaxID=2995223 RepID=A0ABY7BC30_9PSEU|nr:apolipoprotein N-acyltransferase [Amycolatopsis sp. HUAS 11-8]WAL69696.1 apolipoprotein N-acyltransferase [Amycolatopsis sp. HUAS 11-8]